MGAISGEELIRWEKMQGSSDRGSEKILVLVRLRPLSEKEIARNEVSDWECINETTILYRNSLQERSGLPTAYSFDRVYRGDCATRDVYEGGTKDIALSVVRGINSTIFAYGQTSSGKTYTMNGITEYTVSDIFDYMQKHEERAFVLKFSAMEIYNEVVRDLLSKDNTQLRLLDDPEKGTVVEHLTEETLRDWSHLKELLSICEAQRQIGETSLNETSSRSHQILRLTIESSAREFVGKDNSTTLAASVNFVDLAGSERASQAMSVGQRLKEGCHINRSLLTLGTVIRKLSKARNGHVNYRDSKLTRILQPALGGNARTVIICTLSPARSHVEQSRNTLLFASCAKEVSTNAQVNVVMSDKALVKQLQKELARLESELRTPGPTCDHGPLLKKKDLQIEKLEKEVKELARQRDAAQSRVDELLKTIENDKSWKQRHERDRSPELQKSDGFAREQLLSESYYVAVDDDKDSSDSCKEVRCIEMDNPGKENGSETFGLSNGGTEGRLLLSTASSSRHVADQELLSSPSEQTRGNKISISHRTLEQKMKNLQAAIKSLPKPYPDEAYTLRSRSKLARSRSCRDYLMSGLSSPDFETIDQSETTPPNGSEKDFPGRPEGHQRKHWKLPSLKYGTKTINLSRNDSVSSDVSALMDDQKSEHPGDEDIPSVDTFVAGLKAMAKLQYENQLNGQVQGTESGAGKFKDAGSDPMSDLSDPSSDWPAEFERMQRQIVELWQSCNVSLVHRTYFFLLFKGEPMDSIYMEVEIRRLSFLKETFSKGNSAVQDGRILTFASSVKALRREREMLSRLVYKRFVGEDRNAVFQKWGISLNSKQRRLQLVNRLWSETDLNHVEESASVVAKLIRFSEDGQALKEMFGLSFTPPRASRRSLGWKNSMSSLL